MKTKKPAPKKGKTRSAPTPRTKQAKEQYDSFISEYRIDRNGTRAAIKAGYAQKAAAQQAYDLLRIPYIADEIARLDRLDQERLGLTRERVLAELSKLVFFNPQSLVDPITGKRKELHELEPDVAAALTGHEIDQVGPLTKIKYKYAAKTEAIDKAMKHLGLLGKEVSLFAEFEAAFLDAMTDLPDETRNAVFDAIRKKLVRE